VLDTALAAAAPVPGDCGDEYRHPPFLTASGDLTHHLESMPKVYAAEQVPGRPGRWRVDSASVWEPIAGYSRAVRVGTQALVSGTTATHGKGAVVCEGDAEGQAVYILDKIAASLDALGASLDDVVRTRVYLADADDCEAVSRVHGRYFGAVRPANTLLEIGRLVGAYKVEIDAEAIGAKRPNRPRATLRRRSSPSIARAKPGWRLSAAATCPRRRTAGAGSPKIGSKSKKISAVSKAAGVRRSIHRPICSAHCDAVLRHTGFDDITLPLHSSNPIAARVCEMRTANSMNHASILSCASSG
jgi:enamine deaminase RidA (YjgF/YER057c/UK114 family)